MTTPLSFSGVVPALAQVSDRGPPRTECGVGRLMPWAGKLYVLNYSSHKERSGRGTSLRRSMPSRRWKSSSRRWASTAPPTTPAQATTTIPWVRVVSDSDCKATAQLHYT